MQWAVFFDARSRPLTTAKDMVQDDSTAVFVRQITMDSKSIGSFKLGLSTASIESDLIPSSTCS